MKTVKMKLLSLIALCAITSAHNITQLNVPLYADPRRAAELSCHYEMEDQKLHSVKWYRDMAEIFRYTPKLEPVTRLFNVTNVLVQGGDCGTASCMIRIILPPISNRAGYTCEVSTEGPRFHLVRLTKLMTVVAMPDGDPVITSAQKVLKPGESIFLNCTSDYSLPPAEINWYIDDEKQKPEAIEKVEISVPQSEGLRRSSRGLRFSVPSNASGAIRVRCEAILMVEPPVVRESSTILTIHSLTQLSKYVANYSSKGASIEVSIVLLAITLTVKEISRYMSL